MADFSLKDQKAVIKILQMVGNVETPDDTAVTVIEKDESGYVVRAKGTTVPTDAETGYAKGAMFVDTNVVNGTIASYVNVGDHTTANFDAIGAVTSDSVNSAAIADDSVTDADLKDTNLGTESKRTATATADGLTTGVLTPGSQFVTVTSASANNIIALPAGLAGTRVRGWVGANGFELRTVAAGNATINTVDSDGTNEAAIPATTYFECECVATDTWVLKAWDELGAPITAIVPDAA